LGLHNVAADEGESALGNRNEVLLRRGITIEFVAAYVEEEVGDVEAVDV